MTTVLLVDDQALIRSGIRAILSADRSLQVEECENGCDAIARVDAGGVDVVLMDIRMPGMDGVEATRRIRRLPNARSVRILILTTFEGDETVVQAISAGADGFVGKSVEPTDLRERVRSVLTGQAELSAAATAALVKHVAGTSTPVFRVDPRLMARAEMLTPRERDIVTAAATGLKNDEIAAAEHISQYTVKTHINRAMSKLGVTDRGQLVAFAYRAGLIQD